jgi:L-seryl-tRNA(Ser) seleniumtransferase
LKIPRLSTHLCDLPSKAGGGSLPLLELPSCCLGIKIEGLSANSIEKRMRYANPPIIGRIENDLFLIDLRTVLDDELDTIAAALQSIALDSGEGAA